MQTIKLAIIYFQIYALEIHVAGSTVSNGLEVGARMATINLPCVDYAGVNVMFKDGHR